ncbi:lytic polysaccharide monooxygenase auxiliary activity family 9 protein [Allorhizocola rhizosphaerae]|uniref:lytic polysaccharide monooxygenase auxiliary activity family 9 protein n=1 Tax=Allorhizocola rhizosphaerae TaxID=1872709 RepID=UPI000E3BBB80|nr:lytic polysaccharide monooxygenase [Allorhizocola rhizosphaerae]
MPKTSRSRMVIAAVAGAMVLGALALVNSASAHGSIVDPPSRNYGCWQRWGNDFQNPRMATEDPMCWQAWQHNTNAMWNWNGLYREGLRGNHQGGIPDGTLCSGGHAEGGRYDSLDAVGAWRAANIGNNFRVKLWDQASHGADYIRVYVTRQGFNALTQPLRWADLELVGQIGNTPANQWTPEPAGGVSIQVPGNAAGRSGRHIIYTIWQASHSDQSYYLCSDVIFPGGSPDPSPSVSPSPSQSPSPSPSTQPGNCTATYRQTGSWSGGFQAEVTVTAGAAAVRGWTVRWTYANGQSITQIWSATLGSNAPNVVISNAGYNGSLGARASTTFGFLGSWNGSNPAPTLTCNATT